MEAEQVTTETERDETGSDPLLLAIVSALAALEARVGVDALEASDEALAA